MIDQHRQKKESLALAAGGSRNFETETDVSLGAFNSNVKTQNLPNRRVTGDKKRHLLEYNTKFVDTFEKYQTFTLTKWKLQEEARRLVGGRLNACHRIPYQKNGRANLYYSQATERAFWHGLITCGRVWLCPVCSIKISSRRLQEIKIALDDDKTQWMMMTFTLQHHKGDRLKILIEDLNASIRKLYQSRVWKNIKKEYGLIGGISGFEIRYSERSGWHPHRHVIFAFERNKAIDAQIASDIRLQVQGVIFKELEKRGYKTVSGVTVKESQQRNDAYITKIANEITLGQDKETRGSSYSPFQLLELSKQGETWAGEAFKEYAKATKAKQFIRWSPKLKGHFHVQEMTDIQIASKKQDDDARLVTSISTDSELWKTIRKRHLQGYVSVITAGVKGNTKAVETYLDSLTDDIK